LSKSNILQVEELAGFQLQGRQVYFCGHLIWQLVNEWLGALPVKAELGASEKLIFHEISFTQPARTAAQLRRQNARTAQGTRPFAGGNKN
jgi:hypothetical protein